jgi:hypothetical protein
MSNIDELSNNPEAFYLGSFDSHKEDLHGIDLGLDYNSSCSPSGLYCILNYRGLSYTKMVNEEAFGDLYQSSVTAMNKEYTSAPAAFGAGDYNNSSMMASFGYMYDYNSTYPYQDFYALNDFSELHDEIKKDEYEYPMDQTHVNPAMLDVNYHGYTMESGQTIGSQAESPDPNQSRTKPRTTGQPTNIVATGKMDRKTLKRLRNRVSASRCRIKKKEWINEMEDQSMLMHQENNYLIEKIHNLEEQIAKAKSFLEFCP